MHTHALTVAGSVLTKRYASWERGEHRREWWALNQLQEHAPGLAPRPLGADLEVTPPVVTMSVIPGEPLPDAPSPAQLDGLGTALARLWAVPPDPAPELGPWRDDLAFARRLTGGPRPSGGPTADAWDAAVRWWESGDPQLLATPPPGCVLGHRDPNLANYLWDGARVRIVDFEDAARSDPATELAILLEHMSARKAGVGALIDRLAPDPVRLIAARRLWAMFWLSRVLPGGRSAGRNPPSTADAQARRLLDLLET